LPCAQIIAPRANPTPKKEKEKKKKISKSEPSEFLANHPPTTNKSTPQEKNIQ